MDYQVNQEEFILKEMVLDESKEQPVDVDFNLPDYCKDVQRILKCYVVPKISNYNVTTNSLEIEGVANINVLYSSASSATINLGEHSMPFTCSFALNNEKNGEVFSIKTRVLYINCRAVSSRRLDIHGAFCIDVRAFAKKQCEIVYDVEGDNIEQKKVISKMSDVEGMGTSQFSIEENIELPSSITETVTILYTDIIASNTDCKALDGKVVLKGNVSVKLLYVSDSETGELKTTDYSVALSQVINVEGATSESVYETNLEILNYDVFEDAESETPSLVLQVNFLANAVAYKNKETALVADLYSTEYELETVRSKVSLTKFQGNINGVHSNKVVIETNEEVLSKVIDIWNDIISITTQNEENQVLFKIKMNICIIYINNEEKFSYNEKIIEFDCKESLDKSFSKVSFDTQAETTSLAYRIFDENKVEIKIENKIITYIYEHLIYNAVTDITIDKEKPKKKDSAALVVYYADAKENIFDIARKHNTSLEVIKTQNNLQDDILKEDAVLLIPVI
ncbi:MAG: DUF3794 domain-containing protein [Oscillospiraceae bacterium]|jgi:hypothetical protein|nr:DUF3794 domain-containing protein [Oscillospiraceae bacterium]